MSVNTGYDERQALCCECGNLRTCRRPRNFVEENWYLGRPVDRDWRRELGDLKCANCGRITRHALLYPKWHSFKDHAERIERIALGGSDPLNNEAPRVAQQIKKNYRVGRQTNPYLIHLWRVCDENKARDEGRSWVTTHCGEREELPPEGETVKLHNNIGLLDPIYEDLSPEYDDDAPAGMGWEGINCPACYRISNERRLAALRAALLAKLNALITAAQELDASTVGRLIAVTEEVVP
ncbi:Uncharacterised protein [Mycobacteroides abscessus subsp. massiliense]|uniref:hypothetical protein n=1 Tax=Mycobacteroides abscessus TaxID=36809 RepID=UPI0009A5AF40|nr:hypothetical protein [Mycobacteroides abscessus]SLE55380.1 Uncharacterised protein [Mycobacteroides abscessus subsp. massiliense]SLH46597.1 Uncharacterised protein [Mycobacteroides abscessus subsp. massiliense]